MNKTEKLLNEFFQNKSPLTSRSYKSDLEKFRQYLDLKTISEAVSHLIEAPDSQANLIVLHFKVELIKTGTKPGTINRRLSTLRSLLNTANKLNLIPWKLDINNEPLDPEILESEVSESVFQKVVVASKNQKNRAKARRDLAIIRLLHDLALKRYSITKLDTSDFNPTQKSILVKTPGRSKKVLKQLPTVTFNCLKEWLEARGGESGPMFVNFDHARKGLRLSGSSVYRIVRALGKSSGVIASPQIIRNAAIRKALKIAEREGVELPELTDFSGHKNPASLHRISKKKQRIQLEISKSISG